MTFVGNQAERTCMLKILLDLLKSRLMQFLSISHGRARDVDQVLKNKIEIKGRGRAVIRLTGILANSINAKNQ